MGKFLYLLTFLIIGCNQNPNRTEILNVGNYTVKKYFKNNSKIRTEIIDKSDNHIFTSYEYKNGITEKLNEYYPNGKIKVSATLLHKPNFFSAKKYFENGKIECEGSYEFIEKENKLLEIDYWIFNNEKTGEVDSIVQYLSNGKRSIPIQVDKIDNKKHKIKNKKYFDVTIKGEQKDSMIVKLKKVKKI